MERTIPRACLVFLILCSGCYFYYPDVRRGKSPSAAAGTEIEVKSAVRTGYRTCGQNLEGCVVRNGVLKRGYKYTVAELRYDGKVLEQGELRALVKPESHAQKYQEIEDLKGTCNLSLIPSVISAAGSFAVTAGAAGGDSLGETGKYIAIGGAIAMIGGAILSYPIGGYACMKARRLAAQSGISHDRTKRFYFQHNSDYDMQRLEAIDQAVSEFNARAREVERNRTPPVEQVAPPDEAPEPAAPEDKTLRDAVEVDGRFTTFLRLYDALGMTQLSGSVDYTVLAPTDAAFAKLPPGQVEEWLAATGSDKTRAKHVLLRHFIRTARSHDELLAESRLRPARGSSLEVRSRDGRVVVEGGVVSGDGVMASNGVVYAIDRVIH